MRIRKKNEESTTVDFATLEVGTVFYDSDGDLIMKTDHEQDGVDLSTGAIYTDHCGDRVTPVRAEVQILD